MGAKTTPHDHPAEEAVATTFLLFPLQTWPICEERRIEASHFLTPLLGRAFECMMELCRAGVAVEMVTLRPKLLDDFKEKPEDLIPFISNLAAGGASLHSLGNYLDILEDRRQRRQMIALATRLQFTAHDLAIPAVDLAAKLTKEVTELLRRKVRRKTVTQTLQEIALEVQNGQEDSGLLKTGMSGVDGRLTLFRGDLLIISAPTSCGKSTLAAQLALNLVLRNERVAIYPLEMTQKQMLKRAIAQLGDDSPDFVRKLVARPNAEENPVTRQKVQSFAATVSTLCALPIHIRDDLHRFEEIVADLRCEHMRRPFSFVAIDYLQIIQTAATHERKQLQIAYITQGLKALAKDLDCVICVPSQVNKDGGTREAQDAENDASSLVKIHALQDEKTGDISPGRIEVWKQRDGYRHIDLPLIFNSTLTRFEPKPN